MKKIQRRETLRILLVVSIIVLLLLTFTSVLHIIVLALFLFVNLLIAYLKKRLPMRKYLFGIEAVMFCTVLTAVNYGPKIGSVMGGLLMIVNYIGEKRFSKYFVITLVTYSIIGYVSYYLRYLNIIGLGIGMVISYNLLMFTIVPFFGANKKALLVFSSVNILFNILLFATFGTLVNDLVYWSSII